MTELGSQSRPLRVAIIGAGPSGMYAADALFKSNYHLEVDILDRLPTLFGLLRGGVAPDHQKMKSLSRFYDRIFEKNPSLSFYGNIKVGSDVTINELRHYYDAIIACVGAETDRKLNIEGISLQGSHTATEFVGWYNGHPDFQHHQFNLHTDAVAVIGQGNVAIDVARILAKTTDELSRTDITQNALDQLAKSDIKTIYLIGRRGPVQAAFTHLEIKELGELSNCDIILDPKEIELSDTDKQELLLEKNSKARKNIEALQALAKKQPTGARKKIIVKFCRSPKKIKGNTNVTGLELEINQLQGKAGAQYAIGSGQTETLPVGLVFRSIGYHGIPLSGFPFDEGLGIIPNIKGRVIDNHSPISGLYTSGWIKRGPSGVLGTNKPDSMETVKSLLEDVEKLSPCTRPSRSEFIALLHSKNIPFISYEDYQKVDEEECRIGQQKGKPREKFTSLSDILSFLRKK